MKRSIVWWAPPTEVAVYLGRRHAWVRRGRRGLAHVRYEEAGQFARADWTAVLAAATSPKTGRPRVRVLLGTTWCRFLTLTKVEHLGSADELQALARGALTEKFGAQASEWQVAVPRRWGQQALACAIPARLVEELQAACASGGAELVSVRPWLVAFLRRHRRRIAPLSRLAVREPESLALLVECDGALRVDSLPLDSEADLDAPLGMLAVGAGVAGDDLPVVTLGAAVESGAQAALQGDFTDRCVGPIA